jgi:hypothetical protein
LDFVFANLSMRFSFAAMKIRGSSGVALATSYRTDNDCDMPAAR